MNKKIRSVVFYVFMLLALIFVATWLMDGLGETKIKYSDIVKKFEYGEVREFNLEGNKRSLRFKDGTSVTTKILSVSLFYEDLKDTIKKQLLDGTLESFDYPPPFEMPWWVSMLPSLVLIGIMVLFWFYMMNQSSGGGKVMSFGKARAKLAADEKRKVTFNDVAGLDEEKEELREIVDFLRSPRKFVELGARIPKGVLLVGSPGTGKTYLAKAVAGEAGVPFFSISGSDFVEMYVGVGASRVRDLFETAKKSVPCIVFIDEIDAVGRHRGAGLGGGHDEREQTLNQLLVEMDGFGVNEGIIIIAATNRPDILDPALLRPGRFDRQITVGLPDIKGRKEILQIHSRGKPLSGDVDLAVIAKSTPGFTPADLENLMNEAALFSARHGHSEIIMSDIEAAIMKIIAGPEKKSRVISEKEKKLTCYHEAGHAIVTYLLPTQDPVHQISIIPRGRIGGYTLSLPTEDKYYAAKGEMLEEIVSLLGGRVSEQMALDDISTGASNDIERATTLARNMVTKYGMSDRLGPIVFGTGQEEVFLGRDISHSRNYSEDVAAMIDEEIKTIIGGAYAKAKELLERHIQKLHEVASYLFSNEVLSAEQFDAIMNGQAPGDVQERSLFERISQGIGGAKAHEKLADGE